MAAALCTVCLIHFAAIDPCPAEPTSAAKPNVRGRKRPLPAARDAVPRSDRSADSATEVARAPGSGEPAATADPAGATGAPPPTIANDPSTGETKASRWAWLNWANARRVLQRFAPSISLYYARSIAHYDSSDFGHSLGFIGAVDYTAMPSLILSTDLAVYREFGEDDERFVASNMSFGVTRTFDLPPAGVLYPRFFFKLPTNPDDREFLSYRGSVGVDVELRKFNFYKFHPDHAFGGSVGLATARNIYDKTTNQAGYPNRILQVSGYASLNYKFRQSLMFIVKFRNNWFWYPDGARANDLYQLSASLNYSPIKQLWLALSAVSSDRTFLYDQTTLNVALYSPEATSVVFTVTYLPRLSKTHELSR
jgi:hypothetical protein